MRSFPQTFTVGTSTVQILWPHHKREVVILSGDGLNTFTITQSNPVVPNQGYVIGPTVPTIEISWSDLGDNIRQPFFAICSAAGGKLYVVEGFS